MKQPKSRIYMLSQVLVRSQEAFGSSCFIWPEAPVIYLAPSTVVTGMRTHAFHPASLQDRRPTTVSTVEASNLVHNAPYLRHSHLPRRDLRLAVFFCLLS